MPAIAPSALLDPAAVYALVTFNRINRVRLQAAEQEQAAVLAADFGIEHLIKLGEAKFFDLVSEQPVNRVLHGLLNFPGAQNAKWRAEGGDEQGSGHTPGLGTTATAIENLVAHGTHQGFEDLRKLGANVDFIHRGLAVT